MGEREQVVAVEALIIKHVWAKLPRIVRAFCFPYGLTLCAKEIVWTLQQEGSEGG